MINWNIEAATIEASKGIENLFWNEWDEQEWKRNLTDFNYYSPRASRCGMWDECIEIMYWEPLYHPINAFIEIKITLNRMRVLFFREYDEFEERCFNINSQILECGDVRVQINGVD